MVADGTSRWRDLVTLLERFSTSLDRDSFIVDALDTLVDLCGAERGLVVLIGADGARHVAQARGQGRALSTTEREEVSRTILARAFGSRSVVTWSPLDEADTSESLMEMEVTGAMAAALRVPDKDLPPQGVVYVDYRDPLRTPTTDDASLLGAAAGLMSAVLVQGRELAEARDALTRARARGDAAPRETSLADFLRFPSLDAIRTDVLAGAGSNAPVLIRGESGTGKTLLASAIGRHRNDGPVVRAVFAGSDDLHDISLMLFGRREGAVAGAPARRGLVSHADGGTLILDEVLHLPLRAQELLLDLAQFGTYRPIGYDEPEPLQAKLRLVATTNGDLDAAVADGTFRQDLWFRLAGTTITLPPLRERREDIPALSAVLLHGLDPERPPNLSVAVRKVLLAEPVRWTGNVRQLESTLGRAWDRSRVRDDGHHIALADLRPGDLGLSAMPNEDAVRAHDGTPADDELRFETRWADLIAAREQLESRETELLEEALLSHDGSVSKTARALGLSRTSLASRLNTLGIKKR